MTTLNILKENCDPKKDNNSTLPYNAYLVQYKIGDKEETGGILPWHTKCQKYLIITMTNIKMS